MNVVNDEGLSLHPDVREWAQVKDIVKFVEELECTDKMRLQIFSQALSLGHVSVPLGVAKRKPLPDEARSELKREAAYLIGQESRRLQMELERYLRTARSY